MSRLIFSTLATPFSGFSPSNVEAALAAKFDDIILHATPHVTFNKANLTGPQYWTASTLEFVRELKSTIRTTSDLAAWLLQQPGISPLPAVQQRLLDRLSETYGQGHRVTGLVINFDIFKTGANYQVASAILNNPKPEELAGQCLSELDIFITLPKKQLEDDDPNVLSVIVHEYIHTFINTDTLRALLGPLGADDDDPRVTVFMEGLTEIATLLVSNALADEFPLERTGHIFRELATTRYANVRAKLKGASTSYVGATTLMVYLRQAMGPDRFRKVWFERQPMYEREKKRLSRFFEITSGIFGPDHETLRQSIADSIPLYIGSVLTAAILSPEEILALPQPDWRGISSNLHRNWIDNFREFSKGIARSKSDELAHALRTEALRIGAWFEGVASMSLWPLHIPELEAAFDSAFDQLLATHRSGQSSIDPIKQLEDLSKIGRDKFSQAAAWFNILTDVRDPYHRFLREKILKQIRPLQEYVSLALMQAEDGPEGAGQKSAEFSHALYFFYTNEHARYETKLTRPYLMAYLKLSECLIPNHELLNRMLAMADDFTPECVTHGQVTQEVDRLGTKVVHRWDNQDDILDFLGHDPLEGQYPDLIPMDRWQAEGFNEECHLQLMADIFDQDSDEWPTVEQLVRDYWATHSPIPQTKPK